MFYSIIRLIAASAPERPLSAPNAVQFALRTGTSGSELSFFFRMAGTRTTRRSAYRTGRTRAWSRVARKMIGDGASASSEILTSQHFFC